MKLLFDQNLSPKLVNRLADLFPGSSHVQTEGLDCADDGRIWEHARQNGFAIVTKDADFVDSHLLQGRPAKLLLISTGNINNRALEALMVPLIPDMVREFQAHSFLELGQAGLVVRG